MHKDVKNLKPAGVWEFFNEICKIPRPSRKEEKIIAYISSVAHTHNLEYKQDKAGNILIRKPSYPGMEHVKTVILQGHLDMVGEKNNETVHNFDEDPIIPIIDGDWVKAKGTTLGADDGIGIAAQLSILVSKDIPHGPLECLFTVDEESGMTGAHGLQSDFFKAKILLNLDSEDEGELFIGCAGGVDTVATMPVHYEPVPGDSHSVGIWVNGLRGGHSGDEIDKGGGNSIKILNRFLWKACSEHKARLVFIDGGNKRNAIPREAHAILAVPRENLEELKQFMDRFRADIRFEYALTEPDLNLQLTYEELQKQCMTLGTQNNLLQAIYACPHGVKAMSQRMPGLVETSTNLASIKMKNHTLVVTTSQRSSVESAKMDVARQIESLFTLAGAEVVHSEGYPGWTPNTSSEIVRITRDAYKRLFGREPVIRAVHAGLECGLILEKYPELDMISFGPTIKGAHSPDERLNIETVTKFWRLLLEVLKNIPEN
jgi:dipeptidase D